MSVDSSGMGIDINAIRVNYRLGYQVEVTGRTVEGRELSTGIKKPR